MAKNDESNSEQEQPKEEQKFNQEQYEMLLRCSEKEDISEWNLWRVEHPDENILLKGANLLNARLEGAKLESANLKGADLWLAHLEGADLVKANLEGAKLVEARLRGANLERANLKGADLEGAYLERAKLVKANLEGAKLVEAYLRGANLMEAHLKSANLVAARLHGADLFDADLDGADLYRCRDVAFDSTYILNTRHIPMNPWHKLRNKYTGINLAFHLILLVSFVLIYSGKAMFYYGIHMGQEKIIKELNALESLLQEEPSLNERNETSKQRSEITKDIILAASEMYGKLRKKILKEYQDMRMGVSEKFDEKRVWQILLSQDKGIWFQFTTIVLIIYNALRYVLTGCVAPLSAEEDRSHYTPSLFYYSKLMWFHRVNSVLWFVALGSFAIHCYDWMTAPVLILK